MSIVRISHDKEKPYVMVNRTSLHDPRMCWNTRGLWSYLIGLPDNWEVSVAHLTKVYSGSKRGNRRDALYEMLKELIDLGYVQAIQKTDEKGHFGRVDYVVYESRQMPQEKNEKINQNASDLKKKVPLTAKPFTDEPLTVKPTQTINNDKEEIYKENDMNVSEDRSSHAQNPIVPFCPESYVLPNGKGLSIRFKRSISKYSEKDRQKLQANVFYFENQIKNGKKWDNPEAYLQNCIKYDYAAILTTRYQNELYAMFIKEEHNLKNMQVLKTVVQIKKNQNEPPISISLSLPTETFSSIIKNYLQIIKDKS